ncbi:MAG TPA: RDD family protein [Blastocatellia bacterium]|jgi:uncharacterized RDD family membrane protein YckC|nr:RDD family protein [Blastocatellia bacterium]
MTHLTSSQDFAPPAAGARTARGLHLASIGLRCGAFLLDYILTLLVPAVTLLLAVYFKRRWAAPDLAQYILIFGYLAAAGLLGLNWIYFCERTGQTFGKRFIGIRVVRADGGPLDYRTAALRHFVGYPLAFLCLGLGVLWLLWDRKQQGWHDKLAGTLVVKEPGDHGHW